MVPRKKLALVTVAVSLLCLAGYTAISKYTVEKKSCCALEKADSSKINSQNKTLPTLSKKQEVKS